MIRKIAGCLLAVSVAAGGGAVAGHAVAGASAPNTVQCQAGVSPACQGWQDPNAGQVVQDLELTDHAGQPIWWCNNAGGCWVGNDKMGVTGASVFDLAAYLSTIDGTHGELVIDGQAMTGKDIAFLVCLNHGGSLAVCRNGG